MMELRADPASIAPERALVFEVAGSLPEFYEAAARIGLDFLGEEDLQIEPDEDFRLKGKPGQSYAGRVYFAMPDVAALREMVRLWSRYAAEERMAPGYGAWTRLFGLLKDVRPWGPQDRIHPDTLAYWAEMVRDAPEQPVRTEVELWYRRDSVARQQALSGLREEVTRLGGNLLHYADIPAIRYHAALVDLPCAQVEALLADPTISLARIDDIMFLRPQAVASFSPSDEREPDIRAEDIPAPPERTQPVAALLDGYPVQNHVRLAGRLVVDDADSLEHLCPVNRREHGTAMASLIAHGDLNRGEAPLPRPLYIRPVLVATQGNRERTPSDRLLVDTIYRAVLRIKEGEAGEPAVAPAIIAINLSLGDENRPFSGSISPWAKLLDHLAYRYRVLFLVSAGNVQESLPVSDFHGWTAFEDADPEVRSRAVLKALNEHKGHRTLFSPAEALNVITVGAAHRDAESNGLRAPAAVDPFTNSDLPNISSALGLGFRRIAKPELLLDGGRELVRFRRQNAGLELDPMAPPGRAFGLRVAAPDPAGGDTTRVALTSGTSAATALATRAAHQLHEALMDREGGSEHYDAPTEYQALLVKALLVHGAAWGQSGAFLDTFFGPRGKGTHTTRRDDITRLLGYGAPDFERVIECASNRATMLGYGTVEPGGANLYRIPLPDGLEGAREFRAVTFTLAWFSPINPFHQGYRQAALDIDPAGDREFSLAVSRGFFQQPPHTTIRRGTVLHDRWAGEQAAPFVDGGDLLLRVTCRAAAGDLDEAVPYALAVSIEVGVNSNIQVYDEVRTALRQRVRPGVAGAP